MERNLDDKALASLSKHVVIFGIDPGVTTGISILAFPWGSAAPMPQDVPLWGSAQISYGGSGNIHDLIDNEDGPFPEQDIAKGIGYQIDRLSIFNQVHVVIEDFIIRRVDTSRDFLSPVRITAGILQEIYDLDNVTVHFQSPSDAKGTCTDERMDKWGYTIETQKDRHSRDADRHAVLLLRKMMENPAKFNLIQYKAQP